ncbi:hypothetical protein BDZ45DRAFT_77852 [Acephala macrosclerotiorum]|nr:hypothetical protein BDZ45DRAFT_77852 [Acephala macrosclerotiorum]
MTETQGGSCEPCKRKKCKCDRQLPTCGQCVASPRLCKYAESNKRGIPGGYLGALEARLNDTEAALYNALCEIRRLNQSSTFSYTNVSEPISSRQDNTSKASRMSEWKQYPLQSSKDVETWWLSFKPSCELTDEDHVRERTALELNNRTQAMDWSASDSLPLPGPQAQNSMRVGTGAVPREMPFERAVYSMHNQRQPSFQQENLSSQPPVLQRPQNQVQLPAQPPTQSSNLGYDTIDSINTRNEMNYNEWNPTSAQQVPRQQRPPSDAGSELNRSQQLSARLSHIYY